MNLLTVLPIFAMAGGASPGGGQKCEARIQEIRENIKQWIAVGRHENLEYKGNFNAQDYSQRMNEYLATTVQPDGSVVPVTDIECSKDPIKVYEHDKDCKFERLANGPKITCFKDAFMDKSKMSDDEQYWLIHHEFASLADLEPPSGPNSNYIFSNQITGKLQDELVRKLPISREIKNDYKSCVIDEKMKQKVSNMTARFVLNFFAEELRKIGIQVDINSAAFDNVVTRALSKDTIYFPLQDNFRYSDGLSGRLRFNSENGTEFALQFNPDSKFSIVAKSKVASYDNQGNITGCEIEVDNNFAGTSLPIPFHYIFNIRSRYVVWGCSEDPAVKNSHLCNQSIPKQILFKY